MDEQEKSLTRRETKSQAMNRSILEFIRKAGYNHPQEAERLLALATQQAKGENITLDLKSPFNQRIRPSDVEAVVKMVKNPEAFKAVKATALNLRGPQTGPESVNQEVPGGAVQLYRVKIDGDRTYNISVRPGGDPKKADDVMMATVIDPASGNKVDVTKAFQKAFENADSEAIHIFKPIVPRKLQ